MMMTHNRVLQLITNFSFWTPVLNFSNFVFNFDYVSVRFDFKYKYGLDTDVQKQF